MSLSAYNTTQAVITIDENIVNLIKQNMKENWPAIQQHVKNIREADQKIKDLQQSAIQHKQEALQHKQNALQIKQSVNEKLKPAFVQVLCNIFGHKPPSNTQQIDTIFSTYLSNNEFILNTTIKRPEIKSMTAVINYSKDHPKITACNFKYLNGGVVGDVKTLADYLSLSSCPLTSVSLPKDLSQVDKEYLELAVKSRKNFSVSYY